MRRPESPDKLLEQFNPLPEKNIRPKLNYFFLPYSHELNMNKHMNFQDANPGSIPFQP